MSDATDDDLPKPIGAFLGNLGKTPRESDPRIWEKHIAQKQAEHWAAQQATRRDRAIARGFPAQAVDAVLGPTFADSVALQTAKRFDGSGRRMLLLMGPSFCGKTVACTWFALSRVRPRRTQFGNEPWIEWRYYDDDVRFVTAAQLAMTSGAQWDEDGRRDLKSLRTVRTLVVDDLGTEWKAAPERFDDLLGHRWAKGLTTLMSTNLDGQGFKQSYGARLANRINADGMAMECT